MVFTNDNAKKVLVLIEGLGNKVKKLKHDKEVLVRTIDIIDKYKEAIELLKEFAFYCIDESVGYHVEQAIKVQDFLKTTHAKEWLEEQLETDDDYCECEEEDE